MFEDGQPLFEACITNDRLESNSASQRAQSCYEHLQKLGKDKGVDFFRKMGVYILNFQVACLSLIMAVTSLFLNSKKQI